MADSKDLLARQILEDVLHPSVVKQWWTKNWAEAFPLSFDNFDIDAALPAVLYMFRRGFRRGAGQFAKTFGKTSNDGKRTYASARSVAGKLATRADVDGFDGSAGSSLLADLLLAFSLQNKTHVPGRDEPLIRAYPSHYLASWIDLPTAVASLRYVPEMLTALLADQLKGNSLTSDVSRRTRFPITQDYEANDLLRVFSVGMRVSDNTANLNESFDEACVIGVDQLLMVRIAHEIGEAPRRLTNNSRSSGDEIPNRYPIATVAASHFREDLRIFLRAYGRTIPRQAFLPMLETGFCVGLSNVLLSTADMLYAWRTDGRLPEQREQQPATVFIDCSAGGELRRASEQSVDELLRRLRALPSILATLRILDHRAEYKVKSRELPPRMPQAAPRIDVLGDLLHGRLKESERVQEEIDEWTQQIAEQLQEADLHDDVVTLLRAHGMHAAERLGKAIAILMGEDGLFTDLLKAIDSAWGSKISHGLLKIRRVNSDKAITQRRTRNARSIVFSDAFLDFAVHRHLFKAVGKQRPLSFVRFLEILRERYGFYVDQAPPGQNIRGELLQRNRAVLETRLRDLGLLVGVNDAESMKFLRPRFAADVE
jgi:hypothetical protein